MLSAPDNAISNNVGAVRPPLIATIMFCCAFLLVLITAWGPTLEHVDDPFWRPHQQFHALRELFMATFFAGAGLWVCLGPLSKGRPHALNMVMLLGVGVVAGFFVGLPVTGIGKEGVEPFINHGLQLSFLLSGYFICKM